MSRRLATCCAYCQALLQRNGRWIGWRAGVNDKEVHVCERCLHKHVTGRQDKR